MCVRSSRGTEGKVHAALFFFSSNFLKNNFEVEVQTSTKLKCL